MVAHVLRLRAALLLGAVRPGARGRRRAVAALVAVVVAVAIAWAGLLSLRDASHAAAQVVTVTAGAAILLGFLIGPPVSGDADQLDPRRFAPFGLAARPLAGATLLASVLSIPVLALLAIAVAVAVLWLSQGAPGIVATGGPLLGVVTALVLARLSSAAATWLLRERRSRELTGLFLLLVLVVVVPTGLFFASLDWDEAVPSPLTGASRVLSLTPFGAAWALPGYAATGDPLGWACLAVALVSAAVAVVGWYAVVDRLLHVTERPAAARTRGGMSWFAVTPATAGGSIAARSLMYWLHDRRYTVNVIIVPIAAIVAVVPLLVAGAAPELAVLAPLPIIALFFGWLPHNDLAYDSTALWLHVASGVRGIADRAGRLVPILLIGVPVLAVAIPLAVALNGRWAHAPALVGVCASLFLSGLGLSSIASAAAPYAVARPGDSPFQQPQRSGGAGILAQALVMLGALAVSGPTLWWGWLAVTGDASYGLAALAGGIATGIVVLGVGLAAGALVFERRAGALMEFAESVA